MIRKEHVTEIIINAYFMNQCSQALQFFFFFFNIFVYNLYPSTREFEINKKQGRGGDGRSNTFPLPF